MTLSDTLLAQPGKKSKRRDGDPVHEYADHRVVYWTGGRPGLGDRKPLRFRSAEDASAKASELRSRFSRKVEGLAGASLLEAMRAFVQHMVDTDVPTGTRKRYRSSFNAHVGRAILRTRCADLSIEDWTTILEELAHKRASKSVINGVVTMLNALVEFGRTHGYFTTPEPFGPRDLRRAVVKKTLKTSRRGQAVPDDPRISLDHCPTLGQVTRYASAFEPVYPDYGRSLVYLAYATGLRIGELLALRVEDIIILEDRTEIFVERQLDRYNHWPATTPPKNGKTRTTVVWDCFLWILEELIDKAENRTGPDHGYLFPPHRSELAWLDQAGKLASEAAAMCDWPWEFRWLRHAFASVSMAPRDAGGYGCDPASVSRWLGHHDLSVTLGMYVVRQADDAAAAKRLTVGMPGTRP